MTTTDTSPAPPAFGDLPTDAEAARAEIDTVMANPVYLDTGHPQHRQAHERALALHHVVTGEPTPPPEPKEPRTLAEIVEAAAQPATDGEIQAAISRADFSKLEAPAITPAIEMVTNWVRALQLPAHDLNNLVARVGELERKPMPADGPELEAHERRDKYDANLAAAKRSLDRLEAKDPRAVPFLEETGLYAEPWLIRALAEAAERNKW